MSCSAYVPKAVEAAHHACDPGADRQPYARTGGGDVAGEVPAETCPLGLVDQPHAVEDAARDREVDRVDRCGGDLDPHLTGSRGHEGDVDDLDRAGAARNADDGGAEGGGDHGFAPDVLCSPVVLPHYQ